MSQFDDSTYLLMVAGWLAIAIVTAVWHLRQTRGSAGLVLGWLLALALIHFLAAVVYALPWYAAVDAGLTQLGFQQSLYAIASFGVGVVFLAPRVHVFDPPAPTPGVNLPVQNTTSVAMKYLVLGSLAYFAIGGLVNQVATLNSILSTGLYVAECGLCLACWSAIKARRSFLLIGWLALSAIFPFATVITNGFLGFGAFAVLSVVCFVVTFYRPRRRIPIVALLVTYVALSIFVTYMRDRGSIRDSVWGGQSFADRFDQVRQSIGSFEWFDPTNADHLARIDGRLNQNRLVGAAVIYLEQGNRDFAHGQTILDAIIAVIPRAIWPSKPIVAGGSSLVSDYTGIDFAFGTSVGVGPVLELYINFGTSGIVVGFIVLGALVGALDRTAGRSLIQGNVEAFTFRYVPALAILNVGDSLGVLTSGAAAAFVMVFLLNRFVLPIVWQKGGKNQMYRIAGWDRWSPPSPALVAPVAKRPGHQELKLETHSRKTE